MWETRERQMVWFNFQNRLSNLFANKSDSHTTRQLGKIPIAKGESLITKSKLKLRKKLDVIGQEI